MVNLQSGKYIYCFTPLVSLATFIIEILFAIYTLYRYRKTEFGIVSFFVLISLAGFQLPEYLLCKGDSSFYNSVLIQAGFISTIFLPALGFHLVNLLSNKKYTRFVLLGYALALLVSVLILLGDSGNFMHACTGKYVTFSLSTIVTKSYFFTYVLLVAASMLVIFSNISRKIKTELNILMLLSFLVFLVPTYSLYFLSFIPNNGIPSVLCGFAILAALILLTKILPKYHRNNN